MSVFIAQYDRQSRRGLQIIRIRVPGNANPPGNSQGHAQPGLGENEGTEERGACLDGWKLGPQLRTRGSLHSDTWIGSAADLADMHTIAVYPAGGWWKYRTAENRWQNSVGYSLIVSIDVPDESVDIYSVIENQILKMPQQKTSIEPVSAGRESTNRHEYLISVISVS